MKIELTLKRTYHKTGTNGTLYVDSTFICHTIELPFLDNQKRISCIPEGTYQIVQRYSEKFKFHLHLLAVPNRSLILIHPANNAQAELAGCIAPVTTLNGHGIGSQSVKARNKLHEYVVPYLGKGIPVFITIYAKQVSTQLSL